MADLKQLYEAILKGDAKVAHDLTEQATKGGGDPIQVVDEYMIPAMNEVGRRFEANEYFN